MKSAQDVSVTPSRRAHRPPALLLERDGPRWRIRSGRPADFGFDPHDLGPLQEILSALLIGRDSEYSASWPMVMLPTGRPVQIHYHLDSSGSQFFLTDASACYEDLLESQQRANEVALAHLQQTRLIEQLKAANAALESRERQLQETQTFQRRLLAALAHDIGTPLTSIIGYAELVGRAADRDSDTARALRAIQRSARVLKDTADNLLELGRTGQVAERAPEALDLADMVADIRSMIEPLAAAKRLRFDCQLQDLATTPPVLERLKVNRILVNLLSNAIRYTAHGRVDAQIQWDGQSLRLLVRDTGIGIRPEFQKRVFEPLNEGAQQGRKGSGLGLSIVRDLVQSMGGELSLESTEGRGTCFEICLPPQEAPISEPAAALADSWPTAPLGNARALVLDDDPTLGELLSWVLRDAGYAAEAVQDVDTALQRILESQPGLVISDLEVGGDTGLRLFEHLRLAGYDGVALLMSGHDTPGLRRTALRAGASAYLPKPLDLRRLHQWLTRVLPRPGMPTHTG